MTEISHDAGIDRGRKELPFLCRVVNKLTNNSKL